jgi:hypothetical protein
MGHSKVRALTRVATEGNETDLLAFALDASAVQCKEYCRRFRNGDPAASVADARRIHEGRSLVRHLRVDGSGTLTVELPREALELVLNALEQAGARLPEDRSRSLFTKRADALVEMARESLAGGIEALSSAEGHQVVVHGCSLREQLGRLLRKLHVDASALSGQGGEADVPQTSGGVVNPYTPADEGQRSGPRSIQPRNRQ